MTRPPPQRPPITPLAFAVVGSEMVAFTLTGIGVDYLAGTMPWATVGLTLAGAVAAMAHLVRMATRSGGTGSPDGGET